jgi:hypothetical protein
MNGTKDRFKTSLKASPKEREFLPSEERGERSLG